MKLNLPLALASLMFGFSAHAADLSATFEVQLPVEPGVFDAPLTSSHTCNIHVNPLVVKWREPTNGVNSSTGLLVVAPGKSATFDCDRFFDVQDASWPDSKNVVVCNVFYRNDTFQPPYDFGKLQITDILRGVGTVLQQYPQLDRRRLYLYGASGGGIVSLQTLQASRGLWAEVHLHCTPTWLGVFLEPPGDGTQAQQKGVPPETTIVFPTPRQKLTDQERARYEAERALRSPLENIANDLPSPGASDYPAIYMMHGTADTGIPVDHMYDLRDLVMQRMGITVSPTSVTGGNRWTVRRWSFFTLNGAGHAYEGADPAINTFNKATNHHVPSAFTSLRPDVPSLALNYSFPWSHGWRFHVEGELTGVTLTVQAANSADADWSLME